MMRPNPPATPHFGGYRRRTQRVGVWLRGWFWLLRHASDVWAVVFHRFDPALRESIMIAVAHVNACRWCSYAHQTWGREVGLDATDVSRLADGELALGDARLAAATGYARERAEAGFGPVPEALRARLRTVFAEVDADRIEVVARLMHQGNMAGNALDALLARCQGRPAAESRLVDELLLGAFASLAIAVAVPMVSIVWWRSPRRVLHELLDFVRSYELHRDAPDAPAASGAAGS